MKYKNLKTTQISFGMFEYGINFICGDVKDAVKFVNLNLNINITEEEFVSARGKCFSKIDYIPTVWIPKPPKTSKELAILSHEMFHAVSCLTDWAGIPLTRNSEEIFCHALAHLVNEALIFLRKK